MNFIYWNHVFDKKNMWRTDFFTTRYLKKKSEIVIECLISQFIDIIEKARKSGEIFLKADEIGFRILPTSIGTRACKNIKNVGIDIGDNEKKNYRQYFLNYFRKILYEHRMF